MLRDKVRAPATRMYVVCVKVGKRIVESVEPTGWMHCTAMAMVIHGNCRGYDVRCVLGAGLSA
jgi:hypothetical protein